MEVSTIMRSDSTKDSTVTIYQAGEIPPRKKSFVRSLAGVFPFPTPKGISQNVRSEGRGERERSRVDAKNIPRVKEGEETGRFWCHIEGTK